MAVNPFGYQPIFDGGAPRVITGYAREIVSGGQFLGASGAAGVVSSGTDSFVTSDIELALTTGSGNFVGIALHDAASGAPVSVATRGTFLVEAGETIVLAGYKVGCNNDSEVIVGSVIYGHGTYDIGRCWTTGSDGDFVVVDIHG